MEWPKDGDGCGWDSQPHHPTAAFVRLQGVGQVRVHQHRRVLGTVKTISIKREGRRWFVVLSCDDVPAQPLPATGAAVGLDVGVASLVTTSDGDHIDNQHHLAASADRLAAAQRDLARKKRGSKRRRKAVRRVAVLHGKVRRQRLDGAHKAALALVRDNDVVVHEALRIANMTRRAAPRPDGEGGWLPNGAAAKSGLNRSILDAGWGVFLTVLAHSFIEQAERLLTAWLLLLLGGFVAVGGLASLTWRGAAVALLLLLVIRPVTGWLAQARGPAGPRERAVISFFGIRGIGSLYYLAFALGLADFGVPREELWAVVAFAVLASIVLHGITATPVMARLDRLRDTPQPSWPSNVTFDGSARPTG